MSTLRHMARWVLVTTLILGIPTLVRAEQAELERQAGEAFERGRVYFDAEDYLLAAQAFEEAYQLLPRASVRYNIARSYELAQVPEKAAEHYRAFLGSRAGSPHRRLQVRQRLQTLSRDVGWVRIISDPLGAEVTVDGEERGSTPLLLALIRGEHILRVQLGSDVRNRTITVEEGETSVAIQFNSTPEESAPEPFVRQPEEDGADVRARETPVSEERERSIRRLHHAFFWTSLVLTLASGTALIIVGVEQLNKLEEFESLPHDDPRIETVRQQGLQLQTGTNVLFGVTGALALATCLFAIFTDWSTLRRVEETSSRFRPSIMGFPGRGASLGFSF